MVKKLHQRPVFMRRHEAVLITTQICPRSVAEQFLSLRLSRRCRNVRFGQWLLQLFLNFSVSLCFNFPLPLQQTKVFFQPCIGFKIRAILIVNYQTQISLKLCDIITTPTLPHTGWCWCHGGNSKIKVSLILFYTIWGAAALAVQILD